jgi:uncharacterized protein (TIGR01777 family)
MRILVTGATGLIGRKVCQELVRRKHDLAIVSRDPEKAAERLRLPAMEFKWDALTDSFPPLALDRVDAIVHLAGEPIANRFWTTAERERILKSRAQGGTALAAALTELPAERRPKVLVAASATGFYGDRPGDDWLTEASPRGTGFLSDVCTAWEKSSSAAGSLCERAVVLRIGIVLAAEGGALQRMSRPFKAGMGAIFGKGQNWVSWIHIKDLARLICDAIENPAYSGVLNAVSPRPVWQAELARELNQALGKKRLWRIPAAPIRLVLRDMSELVLGSARVKPERTQAAGFKFEFESLGSALADIIARETRAG